MDGTNEPDFWARVALLRACCELRVLSASALGLRREWVVEVTSRLVAHEGIRVKGTTMREVLMRALAAAEAAGLTDVAGHRAGEGGGGNGERGAAR